MSLGDIEIRLNLDARDMETNVFRAGMLIKHLEKSVVKADRSIQRHQSSLYRWGRNLRDVSLTLGALPFALQTLNTAFSATIGYVIQANAKMDRLNTLMLGMSVSTTGMADAQRQANEQMEYLFDLAQRTPYNIDALTNSMVKLKSVGLDPMDGQMEALIDSVARFGGTSQHLQRSSIAIQQMIGKTVVSMEELRQQLGEAVPDAMIMMAKGMKMTVGDLTAIVSQGVVEAKNAIEAMTSQMSIQNRGAAQAMSETWDGIMGRISTQWFLLMQELGNKGGFKQLREVMSDLLNEMSAPGAVQAFSDMGRGLNDLMTILRTAGGFVVRFADEIQMVIAAAVAWKVANSILNSSITKGITASVGAAHGRLVEYNAEQAKGRAELAKLDTHIARFNASHGHMAQAQAGSAVQAALMNKRMELQQQISGRATSSVSSYATSVSKSAVAMVTALGPMAAMSAALWAIGAAISHVVSQQQVHNELVREGVQAYDASRLQDYRDHLKGLQKDLAEVEKRVRSDGGSAGPGMSWYSKSQLEADKQRINALKIEIADATRNIEASSVSINSRIGDQLFQRTQVVTQRSQRDLVKAFSATFDEIYTRFSDGALSKEAYELQFNGILESYKTALAMPYVKETDRMAEELEKLIEKQKTGMASEGEIARMNQLTVATEKMRGEIEKILKLQGPKDLVLVTSDKKKKTDLERYLDRVSDKLQKVQAKSVDANQELAQFENRLARGDFEQVDKGMVDRIRTMLQQIHEINQANQLRKKDLKDLESMTKQLANQQARIATTTRQIAEGENPWLKMSTGTRQLNKTIESVNEKIALLRSSGSDVTAEVEKLQQTMADLQVQQAQMDVSANITKMVSATKSLNRELMTERQQIEANHEETVVWLDAWQEKLALTGQLTDDQIQKLAEYRGALNRDFVRKTESATGSLLREWSNKSQAMDRVWARSMQNMSGTLTDFLVKGKGDFGSFLEDLAYMIVQAQLNSLMAQAFGGGNMLTQLGSSIAGLFSAGPATAAAGTSVTGTSPTASFATGGIMTEHGKATLRQYANGGIAHSPQIALYGEGSRPEAYVPLPDGRTIPVTMKGGGGGDVQVNIINQSGQQVSQGETEKRMDGEKMILDVVLKAATRPGAFRTGMKGAMS